MNREMLEQAHADALLHGFGVLTVGFDPASMAMVVRHLPALMIIDEIEPLMSEKTTQEIYEILRLREEDMRVICIGHPDQLMPIRPPAGLSGLAALDAAMEPITDPGRGRLMSNDQPPGNPRHHKPLSKKNYAAPRQSFRGRMRSVNRNR